MRKITEDATRAFFNNYCFNKSNTQVNISEFCTTLELHGNTIAKKDNTGIYLSHCGWETPTTKERLNGILDRLNVGRVYQQDFVWYWKNDKQFKDGWNKV